MKTFKWVALVTLVGASFAFGQGSDVSKLKGKQIPAFFMTTFDGKKLTSASLKGKPVVLDFWATWCGPCKAASPTMQAFHDKYASKGLMVIGVNMGEDKSTMKKAANYAKEHKYTYCFTKENDAYAGKLGIQGIPCFIFIDKSGKVVAVETGFGPEAVPIFEAHIKKIL